MLVISGTHVAILAASSCSCCASVWCRRRPALAITVLAAWLYALVTGGGAPCVRSAAGLTLAAVCRYFYRDRRPINLLAGVALAFLVFDPEQLFDSSFQLTFLAVAFLGLFAAPLIRATSGPLARGLAGLADTGRDMHLEPRVAQFRIEMRLLAETLRRWLRLPARAARLAVTVPARVLFFFWEVTLVSAVVQAGIALPMVVYFHRIGITGPFGQRVRGADHGAGGAGRVRGRGHRLGVGGQVGGVAAGALAGESWAGTPASSRTGASPCRRCGWRWLFSAALIAVAAAPGRRWRGAARWPPSPRCLCCWCGARFRRYPPGTPGDDHHRRGPGRQHPAGVSRRPAHAGGWRRHPALSDTRPRRSSISART